MLQVTLFGAPQVDIEGQPLVELLQAPRVVSMLAYLALHADQPQPRSLLASIFWPEIPEAQARRNVTNILWRLHNLLGEASDHLEITRQTACLNISIPHHDHNTCWIDVHCFEQYAVQGDDINALEQALQLYRGDLLQGLGDDWIVHEAERLHESYMRTMRQLTALYRGCHKIGAALRVGQCWLKADPLDEDAHHHVIELLIEAGKLSDATFAYQFYAHTWQSELNLPPSTRMEMLGAQLKKSQLQLRSSDLSEIGSLATAHNIITDSAIKLARLFRKQYLYQDALSCYELAFQHMDDSIATRGSAELIFRRECDGIIDVLGNRKQQSVNLQRIQQLAQKTTLPADDFDAHMRWLWFFLTTDAFVEADAEAQSALALCEKHSFESQHRAALYRLWGIAAFNAGEFVTARERYQVAYQIDMSTCNAPMTQIDLVNLAGAELQFRNFQTTLNLMEEARSISTVKLSLSLRTRMSGHEATALLYMEEVDKARRILRTAMIWCRQLGDHALERWLALKRCTLWLKTGDVDRAMADSQYYLAQFQSEASRSEQIEWLEMSARTFLTAGQKHAEKALKCAQHGLVLAEEFKLHRYSVLLHLRMAQSFELLCQTQAAKDEMIFAKSLFLERNEPILEEEACLLS